jgi:hypothetical protein
MHDNSISAANCTQQLPLVKSIRECGDAQVCGAVNAGAGADGCGNHPGGRAGGAAVAVVAHRVLVRAHVLTRVLPEAASDSCNPSGGEHGSTGVAYSAHVLLVSSYSCLSGQRQGVDQLCHVVLHCRAQPYCAQP